MIVTVGGSGLAELTCARLLLGRGHRVRLDAPPAAGFRPLILNAETVALLDELWGPGLLARAWRLRARQVRWGRAPEVRAPGAAVVIDGAALATTMLHRLTQHPVLTGATPPAGAVERGLWLGGTEVAGAAPGRRVVSGVPPEDPALVVAGRRHLLSSAGLRLARGVEEDVSFLETVPGGWVHLFPLGGGRAVAQAMVPGPAGRPGALLAELLAGSGIGARLAEPPDDAVAIPAAPRLHPAPAEPGRLTVGGGALRLDPIAGSGTAQALRTAILAAAVIDAQTGARPDGGDDRAPGRGQDYAPGRGLDGRWNSPQEGRWDSPHEGRWERLHDHYAGRLRDVFRRHVLSCLRFYGEAFDSADWRHELAAMRAALPAAPPPAGLRLRGLGLVLTDDR
ncbi:hypothetical protein ABGB18_19065 [Nonomuraea sp. B12E4]|uniref:hypothetical protein n=1 Tax=Nonomuraea sp. B12E4 TaxID=3153564 RepID=UPI00325D7A9A